MPVSTDTIAVAVTSPGINPTISRGGDAANDQIAKFMARVVPWPKEGASGYINLHWTSSKRPGMHGRAYNNLSDLLKMARWGALRPQSVRDIYFCLSQQAVTGRVFDGQVTAARSQKSATALKAIWFDIDVKPDKGYPTTEAAFDALNAFIQASGVPNPTAIVASGSGGIHVYWISDRPLTPDEWYPYALGFDSLARNHGLKIDPGITTDSARVLRVPGTYNYKKDPPTSCRLLGLASTDYDFETALGRFRMYERPVTATVTNPATEYFDPAAFPARPVPPGETYDNSLEAGIGQPDAPLDWKPIVAGCPHFKEAWDTRGAGYPQGLWMLDMLSVTFMEDARAVAHVLSLGHSNYSKDETNAMFDRKRAEREERDLGWPSCAAFENAGCQSCAGCPHKGKIKSPLNLGIPQRPLPAPPLFVDPYAEFAGPLFPLDVLPSTLAKFVDAQHHAMGADPSAIAMAALTAVAGAMHAETLIQAGEGWWERPIIWTALIGHPSTMKSPIIERAKKPLSNIDRDRDKRWKQDYAVWLQQNKK